MATRIAPTPRGPSFRSQIVPLFVARLIDLRVDALAVVRRFGVSLEVATEREIEVPLSVVQELPIDAERITGDPHFGLHVATSLPRGAYGLLEFILRSARDVREAAVRFARYQGMLNDLVTLAYVEESGEGVMRHAIEGEPLCVGRHANEFVLGLMVRVLRESMREDGWSPRRVGFAHLGRPSEELVSYFGTKEIVFGLGRNELAVGAADLARPLKSADSALLAVLDEQAMKILAHKPDPDALWPRFREAVRVSLRDGAPRLESVAADLGTSARTLQRRLEARGTSFHAVVEEIREQLARMYVAAGSLGDVDIAFLLGYGERRAFVRAFKRWTGMTPAEARRAAQKTPR